MNGSPRLPVSIPGEHVPLTIGPLHLRRGSFPRAFPFFPREVESWDRNNDQAYPSVSWVTRWPAARRRTWRRPWRTCTWRWRRPSWDDVGVAGHPGRVQPAVGGAVHRRGVGVHGPRDAVPGPHRVAADGQYLEFFLSLTFFCNYFQI